MLPALPTVLAGTDRVCCPRPASPDNMPLLAPGARLIPAKNLMLQQSMQLLGRSVLEHARREPRVELSEAPWPSEARPRPFICQPASGYVLEPAATCATHDWQLQQRHHGNRLIRAAGSECRIKAAGKRASCECARCLADNPINSEQDRRGPKCSISAIPSRDGKSLR